jgi:hypothetical protein
VRDLKIADGAILLTMEPEQGSSHLLLRILDLASGDCMKVEVSFWQCACLFCLPGCLHLLAAP